MSIKNRIIQLEKKHAPQANDTEIFVYYHDKEKGYSHGALGPYYATLDDLATAQGWPKERDITIFIPNNGR